MTVVETGVAAYHFERGALAFVVILLVFGRQWEFILQSTISCINRQSFWLNLVLSC